MFSVGYRPVCANSQSTDQQTSNRQQKTLLSAIRQEVLLIHRPLKSDSFFRWTKNKKDNHAKVKEMILHKSIALASNVLFKTAGRFHVDFNYHMEPTFKCLVIGDIGVGKTSFVQKYVYRQNTGAYKATLGVDFALKVFQWSEDVTIKLQMWDIAGQERFAAMTRVYYKDAHACIVIFDLTRRDSFHNALKWKRDLDMKCSLPDGSPVPCILLGNKCDLPEPKVTHDEMKAFCIENNFIGFDEISVKDDTMVEETMRYLLAEIMRRYSEISLDTYDARVCDTIHANNNTLTKEDSPKNPCRC